MRKFYLENEIGSRIPLNNENGIFLYEPESLGFEFDHEYAGTGSGFFLRKKKSTAQSAPSGTLIFSTTDKGPYENYRAFVEWIHSSKELFYVYSPISSKEYYRKVDITQLEKNEINTYGVLECRITMKSITPWYLPVPLHVDFGEEDPNVMEYTVSEIDGQIVEGFVYDEDPDTYLIYGVGSKDHSAEVQPQGDIEAAVKVTFKGHIINPVFSLIGLASRKIIGECAVEGSFDSSGSLVLSTEEQNCYIVYKASDGTEVDLLDAIDITTNPFFRIPLDEPCEVSISGESILGTAEMQVFAYYVGV